MTSSTPTSKSEQQTTARALPGGKTPWWRRWLEPILVVTIIAALVTALVTGGSMAFQSLKGDIHASEARISGQNKRIDEVKAEIRDVKTELKQDNAELKADVKAMDNKLDRVLEALVAGKS